MPISFPNSAKTYPLASFDVVDDENVRLNFQWLLAISLDQRKKSLDVV